MARTLVAIAAIFALALGAVGLTFSAALDSPADFRFVNGSEPETLDPQQMTGQPEGRIADALFEGLTRRDERTLRPEPGVAESWEVSEDGRRYVFHLRDTARWTDGRPVTASDFTYSWRRLQDPVQGAEYAYILHMVRMAEPFNRYGAHADALEGRVATALAKLVAAQPGGVSAERWRRFVVEEGLDELTRGTPDAVLRRWIGAGDETLDARTLARLAEALGREARRRRARHQEAARRFGRDAGVFALDERTLVVELTAPTPYFLDLTSFYPAYPAPSWVIEQPGNAVDWFLPGKIVGNGPFRLEKWRVNDRIRLVRSETYWGRDEVGVDVIDAFPVENATTALNLYLTGEVDWLPSVYPGDLVDPLSQRPDFYKGPGMIVYYYRFNCRRPPFDDVRVREAVSLAIDRELIVEEVLGLGQLPAAHVVPPGMRGYRSPRSALGRDLERARRLLAEAGYPGGAGLPEIGILYNTLETHRKIAEVIADQLRRGLGLRARAYNQEWQSYLATLRAGDYDLARAGWVGDYLDPNTFLDLWVTNNGNNQTGWSHPVYDRLIEAAADVERFVAAGRFDFAALKEADVARQLVEALAAADAPAARRRASAALRMQLLAEAEAILVQDEFPIMPIYFYVVSGLVSPSVEGFYSELVLDDGSRAPNLQDLHPLRAIRMGGRGGSAR